MHKSNPHRHFRQNEMEMNAKTSKMNKCTQLLVGESPTKSWVHCHSNSFHSIVHRDMSQSINGLIDAFIYPWYIAICYISQKYPATCALRDADTHTIPGATELSAPCSRLSALSVSALAQRARQKFYSPPGYPGFCPHENVRFFAPPCRQVVLEENTIMRGTKTSSTW